MLGMFIFSSPKLNLSLPVLYFIHKALIELTSNPNMLHSGASLQRLGKHREAIKYHTLVLAISEREGEDSGNTEAYGAIADCYTELGDLEQAGKFYDKYIARLEKD